MFVGNNGFKLQLRFGQSINNVPLRCPVPYQTQEKIANSGDGPISIFEDPKKRTISADLELSDVRANGSK